MSRRVAKPARPQLADVLGEAVASIVAWPGRAILTCLGTLLGVAWIVAVLGLASTATGRVATDFAARLATVVIVRPGQPSGLPLPGYPFPRDVQQRLDALHGVLAAGVFWQLKLGEPVRVAGRSQSAGPTAGGKAAGGPPVIAATPGFLAAARVRVSVGRAFGGWDQAHAVPACLVGAQAAKSLGIGGLDGRPAIVINQVTCVIIGIVGHVGWRQPILRSVLLPSSAAMILWGTPGEPGAQPAVLLRTRPGAAQIVARQAPLAISPARAPQFMASVPAAPLRLRNQVNGTLGGAFLLLGWLGLAAGGLAIATFTTIWVPHRAAEFALRRSVGARRRHIAAQILAETAILGLIGGFAGTSLGVAVVVILARARNWTPIIDPRTLVFATPVAAAAGVLAGLLACVPGTWIAPARTLSAFPLD
jgi:putative ABC transport system permease protein